jgi:hypothetical protein
MVRNETAANRHLRMVVPRWAKCEIGQDLAFNVANAAGFLSRNVFAEAVAEATH